MTSGRAGFPVARGRSYLEIEEAAMRLRDILLPGTAELEPFPGLEIFERLDRLRVVIARERIAIDFAVNELPARAEGLTLFDAAGDRIVVVLSPETYRGLEAHEPRANFSLGHELGHVALHSGELVRRARTETRDAYEPLDSFPVFQDAEWQANSFSAALLVPALGLSQLEAHYKELTPRLVGDRFKVSLAAAAIRLQIYLQRRDRLIGRCTR